MKQFKVICCFDSRHVVGYGIEEEDRKHTWMEDSEAVSFSALYLCQLFIVFCFFFIFFILFVYFGMFIRNSIQLVRLYPGNPQRFFSAVWDLPVL